MSFIVAEVEILSDDPEKGEIVSVRFSTPSSAQEDLDKMDTIARAVLGHAATRGGFTSSNELKIDFLIPPESLR